MNRRDKPQNQSSTRQPRMDIGMDQQPTPERLEIERLRERVRLLEARLAEQEQLRPLPTTAATALSSSMRTRANATSVRALEASPALRSMNCRADHSRS